MRVGRVFAATVVALIVCSSAVTAQDTILYNQRVRWAAPPVGLSPTTIQLRVVDARTGIGVPAFVCSLTPPRLQARTAPPKPHDRHARDA